MQMRDVLTPILEAAEGVKADMVARGWSAQNAETVAAGFAQTVLRGVAGGGS
ncbi:hypothetical protein [Streptomyces sp. NPDC047097]|uniref:hypothetical protein n=1 Tax=Streptomyces sp. NPDC047097 TaxID=3155260 RepID=UPI0033D7C250